MSQSDNKKKRDILREQGLTYDDYANLDDGNRYELVDGRLELMSPGPSVTHQMVSAKLQYLLTESCSDEYFVLNAPIDLILSETEVRQPDLVLIHRSRLDILAKRGIVGIPDLVVEVLSPSTIKRDKLDKLKVYAQYHIPEYWIIDHDTQVLEQYLLNQSSYELTNIYMDDEQIQSDKLPCVSLTMNEIMARIPDIQ